MRLEYSMLDHLVTTFPLQLQVTKLVTTSRKDRRQLLVVLFSSVILLTRGVGRVIIANYDSFVRAQLSISSRSE